VALTSLTDDFEGLEDWFTDAVNGLARGTTDELDGHLISVGEVQTVGDTKTSCHIRFVTRDGNGRPMVSQLARMLVDHIVDFCIPRSRMNEALDHLEKTGSSAQLFALQREAQGLFTSIDNSGEGGELLLALLLERLLDAPQILCKMSLKTSAQMHVHGTDGVHVRALDGGRLAVYWGESKLHETVQSAISDAFKSIGPYLTDTGNGSSQRDLLLVRNHLDTGSSAVDDFLREYFTEGSVRATTREVRGASLVGFSIEDYPVPITEEGEIATDVADAIAGWHDLIKGRVATAGLESFDLTVFCIPLPSVADFRSAMKHALKV
jgi:hypothetical protein